MMEQELTFEQLCPYVREAGLQTGDFWQVPRRIYDHELMFCLSGRAILTLNHERYVLEENMLAIIPPDTPHTLCYEDGGTMAELAWCHLDFTPFGDGDWVFRRYADRDQYLACFGDKLPESDHIRPVPVLPGGFRLPPVTAFRDAGEIRTLFTSMSRAWPRERDHFCLMSRQYIFRILDLLLDHCGYWSHNEPVRVSDVIIQYIKANFMHHITLADIGRCTQYHADYAGKLFRQETGSTVIEYLNQFRIGKASALLLNESLTITEIAEKCGFQTVNYFSAVSRRLTGKSPRQLRHELLRVRSNTSQSE